MKKNLIFFLGVLYTISVNAQMFSNDYWKDGEKVMVMGKASQLFYELNVGTNLTDYENYANFVYFSLGYGKPNTENAWRKFMPDSKREAPTSKDDMQQRVDNTTSGLHAGTIGIGWQHFFNHWIGFHIQAGWAFIGDFGTRDEDSTVSSSDEDEGEKSTFVYNSVPLQCGIDFNLWKHMNIQAGITYMWKEIPLLTIGAGFVF